MDWIGAASLGVIGGMVPEVMRAVAALRSGRTPAVRELLASVLNSLLGAGVLLFDTAGDSRLQVAILGAAFPQLFSGMVAAASAKGVYSQTRGRRTLVDYIAWRL